MNSLRIFNLVKQFSGIRIPIQLNQKIKHTSILFRIAATPIVFHKSLSSHSSIPITKFLANKMHSEITKTELPTYAVVTIPATADNFMYLIIDKSTGTAAVVDPVEPETVLLVLKDEKVTLTSVLTTHHHWDHAGGNEKLVNLYASENSNKLEVYGGDPRIQALTKKVGQGDTIKVGNLNFTCLHTPCHTTGHICYFLHEADTSGSDNPSVFTGDTLFIAGCGRFFEGTPPQMYDALIRQLGSLPDETLVFCGHEYTVSNLKFSLSVEPNNTDAQNKIAWSEQQRAQKKPTVPSTIGQEKTFNPFMRVAVPALQEQVQATDPVLCMGALRALKDNFKA